MLGNLVLSALCFNHFAILAKCLHAKIWVKIWIDFEQNFDHSHFIQVTAIKSDILESRKVLCRLPVSRYDNSVLQSGGVRRSTRDRNTTILALYQQRQYCPCGITHT